MSRPPTKTSITISTLTLDWDGRHYRTWFPENARAKTTLFQNRARGHKARAYEVHVTVGS